MELRYLPCKHKDIAKPVMHCTTVVLKALSSLPHWEKFYYLLHLISSLSHLRSRDVPCQLTGQPGMRIATGMAASEWRVIHWVLPQCHRKQNFVLVSSPTAQFLDEDQGLLSPAASHLPNIFHLQNFLVKLWLQYFYAIIQLMTSWLVLSFNFVTEIN